MIIDHAAYVAPGGDRLQPHRADPPGHLAQLGLVARTSSGSTSPSSSSIRGSRSMSDRLTGNPHLAALEVPLPATEDRQAFLANATRGLDVASFSDYTIRRARPSSPPGSRSPIWRSSSRSAQRGRTPARPRLLPRAQEAAHRAPGAGHARVRGAQVGARHGGRPRRRQEAGLLDDAELIRRGAAGERADGLPVLRPGRDRQELPRPPASLGPSASRPWCSRTFAASTSARPRATSSACSGVLRSMGPVVVVVDEADAMLGDRDSSGGDSGRVGSRIFGMIANADGRHPLPRSSILWMLLTARPDLLPIDHEAPGPG
jgi:hypothetical protein